MRVTPADAVHPRVPVRGLARATLGLFLLCGAPAVAAPRLVLISVDGLRPDVIEPAVTPNLSALRDAGASARVAINDLPSATMTNHATMLTGLVKDVHHLVLDFEIPGTIDAPTIFDYAAAAGLRSAFFASKRKLHYLAPSDVIETIEVRGGPGGMTEMLLAILTADGPDVVFAHYADPDSTGHRSGWLSDEYLSAAADMDRLIGLVLEAARAASDGGVYVILTADHGGSGTNHFLNTPANREIPWIVAGPGVPPGRVLDEPVSIADTTPTALWLLGLEVPGGLSGVARTDVLDDEAPSPAGLPVPPISLPCVILVLPLAVVPWVLPRSWSARRGQRAPRRS